MSARSLVVKAAALYNITQQVVYGVTGDDLREVTLPYAVALLQVRDIERRTRTPKHSAFLAEIRAEVEILLDHSDDQYRKQTEQN